MKACLVLLLTATLATAAPAPDQRDPAPPSLEGTWEATSVETGGQKQAEMVGFTIAFAGDKLKVQPKNRKDAKEATFKLDATARQPGIDIFPAGEDKPVLGIYEIDGDTLRLCTGGGPGDPRPAKFESKPEGTTLLLTLKRVKP